VEGREVVRGVGEIIGSVCKQEGQGLAWWGREATGNSALQSIVIV